MANFAPCPPSLKPLMHFLKVANEHDQRDVVISYWCRLHALQEGLKLCSGKKTKEETALLVSLMDWLEKTKQQHIDNERVTNDIIAQSYIEEYILKIFKYADEQDKAEQFNKNLVKAFYTCGIVMDVLNEFGPLSEDIIEKQKYAKVKAAYIHNCLKEGIKPTPGPFNANDGSADENEDATEQPDEKAETNDPPSPPPTNNEVIPGFNLPSIPKTTFDDTPLVPIEPAYVPIVQPSIPSPTTRLIDVPAVPSGGLPTLNAEQIAKAQKYCKYAGSALNFDDSQTAVDNLQKALKLLLTGEE